MTSKEEERNLVYRAAEFCSELRIGTVEDFEKPDFVLHRPKQTIGLEVTRYFRKGVSRIKSDREREAVIEKLCDSALQRCLQMSDALIYVSTQWVTNSYPRKNDVPQIVECLANAVIAHLPTSIDNSRELTSVELQRLGLNKWVTSLFILHLPTGAFSSWSPGINGPSSIIAQELQAIINQKNAKIAAYHSKRTFDQLWLLIVADGAAISSYAAIRDDLTSHDYISAFNCIFFVSLGDRSCVELKRQT